MQFEKCFQLTKPIEEVRTMLDKLLDRVTMVDTESIRDIYINVLAMVAAQERTTTTVITKLVDNSTQSKQPSLLGSGQANLLHINDYDVFKIIEMFFYKKL